MVITVDLLLQKDHIGAKSSDRKCILSSTVP